MNLGQIPPTEIQFLSPCACLHFSHPYQSRVAHLCLWSHLVWSLRYQPEELEITQSAGRRQSSVKEIQIKRKSCGELNCIWKPVRKNQFALKWCHYFSQRWLILPRPLTHSCRSVPWSRHCCLVEWQRNSVGHAQVVGEDAAPLPANSPPCGKGVFGIPSVTVDPRQPSSGLAKAHRFEGLASLMK